MSTASFAKILALGLAFALVRVLAADSATPSDEPTVILPPMKVSGSFPADGWRYSRVGQTEFLSQLSNRETKIFINNYVVFQEFLRRHYPKLSLSADFPITVVVCDSTSTYSDFGGPTNKTSTTLATQSGLILLNGGELTLDLCNEYARRRLVALGVQYNKKGYPLWLDLGIREILAKVSIKDAELEIGRLGYREYKARPLTEVFQQTRQSPGYGRDNSLYYQSTVFVHMCLFCVEPQEYRSVFNQFVNRLEEEPFSDELFRECFGVSLEDMDTRLRVYNARHLSAKQEVRRYKFESKLSIDVRDAKPSEVLHLLRRCRQLVTEAAAEGVRGH